jgi:hypothetical protein
MTVVRLVGFSWSPRFSTGTARLLPITREETGRLISAGQYVRPPANRLSDPIGLPRSARLT